MSLDLIWEIEVVGSLQKNEWKEEPCFVYKLDDDDDAEGWWMT